MIRTHFVDSLSCACAPALTPAARLLDIGTGAGFPAIPLKIYRPDLHVTAVDAVSKKMTFVRHVCRVLALEQVACVAGRVEQLAEAGPRFDVIVARAVGSLACVLALAAPLLAADGCLLLQRGPQGLRELDDLAAALPDAGFRLRRSQEVHFSWLNHPRYLIEIQRDAFRTIDTDTQNKA